MFIKCFIVQGVKRSTLTQCGCESHDFFSMEEFMKAVVIENTCSAEEMIIKDIEIPKVKSGWVLVKVKAFGINRSEIMFRSKEAEATYINLPRVPGIECVGLIENPSDSHFQKGDKVIALMGGMGRSFDGSYAEYALLPAKNVFKVNADLEWAELGAIPETFFTAYGSLFECLNLESKDTLLVRGGTSATGIAAIQLAKSIGCKVIATSRKEEKTEFLKKLGTDFVIIDDGEISKKVKEIYPKGVNKVLELVGTITLEDSMKTLAHKGIACLTGILGSKVASSNFDIIKTIPNGCYLTSFFSNYPTQEVMNNIFNHIKKYEIKPVISKVFTIEDISKAHRLMESNNANGKIVVLVNSRE